MTLYKYVASGQRQRVPKGQTFDVNRKALSLYPFVASFKEISLKIFMSTGISYHLVICCKFKKKISLKSDFINFFS